MHELAIAQNIISIVNENIKSISHPKVRFIRMKVGKLSNVLIDSLSFGFETLIQGTNLEGATLLIDEIPIVIVCKQCGRKSELSEFAFRCPICFSDEVEMLSGNELTINEVEIE